MIQKYPKISGRSVLKCCDFPSAAKEIALSLAWMSTLKVLCLLPERKFVSKSSVSAHQSKKLKRTPIFTLADTFHRTHVHEC